MPRITFTETMEDCDCGDDRHFAFPLERQHITTESGDVWCCAVIEGQPRPRPLFPISGAALTEWEEKKAAKAAAKVQRAAQAVSQAALDAKKAELKAKVEGGSSLTPQDAADFMELWVQL